MHDLHYFLFGFCYCCFWRGSASCGFLLVVTCLSLSFYVTLHVSFVGMYHVCLSVRVRAFYVQESRVLVWRGRCVPVNRRHYGGKNSRQVVLDWRGNRDDEGETGMCVVGEGRLEGFRIPVLCVFLCV
jgi:hypothetical protein